MLYDADRKPHEVVYRTHPLAISFGKIIIHSNYMNAVSIQCIQIYRKGCGKGFTLTCFHLSYFTVVKDHAAYKLDVKMPHIENSERGFSGNGKCLREDVIHAFSSLKLFAEFICFGFKRGIVKRGYRRL